MNQCWSDERWFFCISPQQGDLKLGCRWRGSNPNRGIPTDLSEDPLDIVPTIPLSPLDQGRSNYVCVATTIPSVP
ncbi:hypothetical protein PoB_002626200 [Plakobranchus ocellatus]|uniref:Uncharacterized protein n=1 Tax=Plakobranchus ocellatus TaxID=259542 RepID=A0AAV3ZYV7_9GAST|nr:hypothetical protein PoB_002626200 [Plakobranchus ocellatus]